MTKAEADVAELVNGLLFWESDLPQPTTLRTELKQWQRFWQKKDNVTAVSLKQYAVLLKIACTLLVGSCEPGCPDKMPLDKMTPTVEFVFFLL